MRKAVKVLVSVVSLFVMIQGVSAQDDILFRRYLIQSGYHGFYYGLAANRIFELQGGAAAGMPIIVAGSSVIAPLLFNSDRDIDFNVLVLGGHGKSLGWVHGGAATALIFGEEFIDYPKLTVGVAALSSIGGGILGRSLARSHGWSEGRVELYRHYGWVMPFTGFSLSLAAIDDIRPAAASILVSGVAGYYLAHKISDWNEFTRGEVRATQALTILNMGLGFGIMIDKVDGNSIQRGDLILPAAGALAGTLLGHLYTRDAGFTPQQGMFTVYSATGGAIIGLGVALLTESENVTPYYLLPYIGGMGAYIASFELQKRRGGGYAFNNSSNRNNFQLSVMPQNIYLNSRIKDNGYVVNGKYTGMQPLFAASMRF